MDKSKLPIKPKKLPAQERSRATVENILEAATYILTKIGWDGFTTNAIAERAGVNIGSLYQYFPNKKAIVAELQRRHREITHAGVQDVFGRFHEQETLREAITLLIELLIREHKVAPAVHKAMTEELPLTIRSIQENEGEILSMALDAMKPFMKNVPNPELAIYIIGIAAHSIIHNVTSHRPELLENSSLVSELVGLFEGYLIRPTSSNEPPIR